MVAVATLPARPKYLPPFSRPGLAEVRPGFAAANMTGGPQVSLHRPAGPPTDGAASTPGLPGASLQLRNLVDADGNPLIDPDPPGTQPAQRARAWPGTRSPKPVRPWASRPRWSRCAGSTCPATERRASAPGPTRAPPPRAVVQARFNVITGRTSHEVVQIKNPLHPWKAVVIRTITIDRQDDGEVSRYDSGWLAALPASFPEATARSAVTASPCTPVPCLAPSISARSPRRPRPTSARARSAAHWRVLRCGHPSRRGGERRGLRVRAQHLAVRVHRDGALRRDAVRRPPGLLIASQGPLGGPAGPRDLRWRHRADHAGLPGRGQQRPAGRRAAAARVRRGGAGQRGAAPIRGNWSVVARTDDVSEPVPGGDDDWAVPLIRQGPAGGPPSTSSWRLAEPADLWTPDAPSVDYCLLHATDSTRVLFPRLEVDSGSAAFTSDQVPLLADGFALDGSHLGHPASGRLPCLPRRRLRAADRRGRGLHPACAGPAMFPPEPTPAYPGDRQRRHHRVRVRRPVGNARQGLGGNHPGCLVGPVEGVNVRLDMPPFERPMRAAGSVSATGGGVAFNNGKIVLGWQRLPPCRTCSRFSRTSGCPSP